MFGSERSDRGLTGIGVVFLAGVLLLVGLTIVVFAMGLLPQGGGVYAEFDIVQEGSVNASEDSARVLITYESGNLAVMDGLLQVRINGKPVSEHPDVTFLRSESAAVSVGESLTLVQTHPRGFRSGDVITVVFKTDSATIELASRTLE